jgi:hypothetical protein
MFGTPTSIRGEQIKDGQIQRRHLDITTSGQAIVSKLVAGTNIVLSYTGVDEGTGEVTINCPQDLLVLSGVTGFRYWFNDGIDPLVSVGEFCYNALHPMSSDYMYIHKVNKDGIDIYSWLDSWNDSTNPNKGVLVMWKGTDASIFSIFYVTQSLRYNEDIQRVSIRYLRSNGIFAEGDSVVVGFFPIGDKGDEGTSGSAGTSGSSGTSGIDGAAGTDGTSGTSGLEGTSGSSGSSGTSGTSGTHYIDGTSGTSGSSGTSGEGTSGSSGSSGTSGESGTSGTSGLEGTSGTSGLSGSSGSSGTSGTSGESGTSGTSGEGTSGTSGDSGTRIKARLCVTW